MIALFLSFCVSFYIIFAELFSFKKIILFLKLLGRPYAISENA